MAEKPEAFTTTDKDPEFDTKIAGIIHALGIEPNPNEMFLDTLESELVASVNEKARIGVQKAPQAPAPSPDLDNDDILDIQQYPPEDQQKIISKKLRLYQKAKNEIEAEITKLLNKAQGQTLPQADLDHINSLIPKMRSLEKRIDFYTKKDRILQIRQQRRERLMILQNKKIKIAKKIEKKNKEIKAAKEALEKDDGHFLLPGDWHKLDRKQRQEHIKDLISETETLITKQKALDKEIGKLKAEMSPQSKSQSAKVEQAPQIPETKITNRRQTVKQTPPQQSDEPPQRVKETPKAPYQAPAQRTQPTTEYKKAPTQTTRQIPYKKDTTTTPQESYKTTRNNAPGQTTTPSSSYTTKPYQGYTTSSSTTEPLDTQLETPSTTVSPETSSTTPQTALTPVPHQKDKDKKPDTDVDRMVGELIGKAVSGMLGRKSDAPPTSREFEKQRNERFSKQAADLAFKKKKPTNNSN